jgi:excisionase family DNA binding protein
MEMTFDSLPKAVTQLINKVDNLERLLMERAISDKPKTDTIFDIGEAADYCRLSKPTLYSLVSQRSIPFSKKGKRLYFSEMDLLDWIKQGRRKTQTELQEEAANYIVHKKKRA